MNQDAIFAAVGDVLRELRDELRAEIAELGHAKPDALFKSVAVRKLRDNKRTIADFCTEFLHRKSTISGAVPEAIRRTVK